MTFSGGKELFQGHWQTVQLCLKMCRAFRHWKTILNKTVFWNLDINMQRTMKAQCSLLLIVELLMSDDVHGSEFYESVLDNGGQACYQLNISTYPASVFYTQWETHISKGIYLCPKACVLSIILTKDKTKVNTFQKCERILVPVFRHCGGYPKHRDQRPHKGFDYFSCFVSCLFV